MSTRKVDTILSGTPVVPIIWTYIYTYIYKPDVHNPVQMTRIARDLTLMCTDPDLGKIHPLSERLASLGIMGNNSGPPLNYSIR